MHQKNLDAIDNFIRNKDSKFILTFNYSNIELLIIVQLLPIGFYFCKVLIKADDSELKVDSVNRFNLTQLLEIYSRELLELSFSHYNLGVFSIESLRLLINKKHLLIPLLRNLWSMRIDTIFDFKGINKIGSQVLPGANCINTIESKADVTDFLTELHTNNLQLIQMIQDVKLTWLVKLIKSMVLLIRYIILLFGLVSSGTLFYLFLSEPYNLLIVSSGLIVFVISLGMAVVVSKKVGKNFVKKIIAIESSVRTNFGA